MIAAYLTVLCVVLAATCLAAIVTIDVAQRIVWRLHQRRIMRGTVRQLAQAKIIAGPWRRRCRD